MTADTVSGTSPLNGSTIAVCLPPPKKRGFDFEMKSTIAGYRPSLRTIESTARSCGGGGSHTDCAVARVHRPPIAPFLCLAPLSTERSAPHHPGRPWRSDGIRARTKWGSLDPFVNLLRCQL